MKSTSETKREIGLAVSVFGIGTTLLLSLYYLARARPGDDPTLDGVEQFAEGIGYEFQGMLIAACGILVMGLTGAIGHYLGSRVGRVLMILGLISAVWSVAVIVYGALTR
ncbi:hypothetical protein [Stieleria mannarensis]|uniref:hypothetical protein n=1 Tax=Stieleria mannarensis TaxID=2755585 RepID=UPI0015FEDA0B|nr:hypothetical protein [Rhodopirellula sp. JC639]